MDLLSYLLSRKYTDNSIKGISGALAGKNCTIESATKQDGVTTVVFGWTEDNGTVKTTEIQVNDGETPAITSTEITGGHRITFTTTNPEQSVSFDVMDGVTEIKSEIGEGYIFGSKKATITIMDDDGHKTLTSTGLLAFCEERNIPLTLAYPSFAATGGNDFYSIEDLHELQRRGHEVVMHSNGNASTMSLEDFKTMIDDSITFAKDNGLTDNVFVYPEGLQINTAINFDEKLAYVQENGIKLAYNVVTSVENSSIPNYENWYDSTARGLYNYIPFSTMPNGVSKQFLLNRYSLVNLKYKTYIKRAIESQSNICFYLHSYSDTNNQLDENNKSQIDYLKETIDDIITEYGDNVAWVTPSQLFVYEQNLKTFEKYETAYNIAQETNTKLNDIIPSDTSINNKLVNDDKLNDVNQLIADGYTNYEYELALGFYDANGRWNDSSKHASVHDLLSLPSGLTLYFSSTVSGATPTIKEYSSDGTRIRNISGNPAVLTDTDASNRYSFDLLKNSGYEEVPTSGYLMQSVPNYFAEINTDMEQTKTRLDALENRSVYTYDVLTSTLTLINQHTKYVIKRVVEQSINLDSWRLYAGYVKINDQWSNMWLNSDAEGPIKIDNESDFISGFHGDEILQDFTIYKDNEIFDTSVNSEGLLDSLVLYQTSTVYRANSQEAAFTRYKKVSFQGDNYSVQQRWISLISCTITESALALLQCYKTNIIGWDADTLIPLQSKDSGNVELDNGTRRGNIILNGGEMVSIIAEKGSDDFEADLADYTDQNRIKFYFRMFKGKILNVGDVLNSKFSVLLNDYI